jgi:fibronectin-binding autotransporter adhesin
MMEPVKRRGGSRKLNPELAPRNAGARKRKLGTRANQGRLRMAAVSVAAVSMFAAHAANAVTNTADTYTATVGGALDTSGNWSGGEPGVGNDAIINSTTTSGFTSFTLNSSPETFGSLNDTNTNAITITGSQSLTLGGTGDNGNAFSGTASDLLYVASGGTLNYNGTGGIALGQSGSFDIAGAANIGSIIAGSGLGITMTGAGTLTLSNANSFTGTTAVNAGTLNLTGSLSSTALAMGGGSFNYSAAGPNTQSFTTTTINGGGQSAINNNVSTDTLALGALAQTSGSGGSVNFTNTGAITTTTGNTSGILGAWATFGNNGSSTATVTWAANNGSGTIIPYAGYTDVSGNQTGSSASAQNWLSGNTTVNGSLIVTSLTQSATINSLTMQGDFSIASGATLTLASGGLAMNGLSRYMTNNTAATTAGTGQLTTGLSSGELFVDVADAQDVTGSTNANNWRIWDNIVDNGSTSIPTILVKNGPGELTLQYASTYTGGTVVNSGALGSNTSGAIGTGTLTVNTSGAYVMELNGNTGTVGGEVLTLSNNVALNGGAIWGIDGYMHLGTSSSTISVGSAGGFLGSTYPGGTGSYSSTTASGWNKGIFVDGLVSGSGNLILEQAGTGGNGANAEPTENGNQTGTGDTSIVMFTNNSNSYSGTITVEASSTAASSYLGVNGNTALQYATINLVGVNGGATAGEKWGSYPLLFQTPGTGDTSVTTDSFTLGALEGTGNVALTEINEGNLAAGNSVALTVGNSTAGAANATYSGVLSGGGSLTWAGSGTWTLTGSNTYTGGTTISSGVLSLGVVNALSSTGAINVSGGTLSTGSFNNTVGAVTLTSGNITGTSGVLTGTSYAVQSGNVSAILGGTGVALTKTTSGTVTLSATETYTGATAVNGGNLTITGALGNTAVTVGAGTLNLNNASAISQNTLTVNNASSVVTENATNALGGSAALTQSNGTVTLSRANNFSGNTALSGSGTLQLQNAGSIGSSALTLSGGTLQLRNDTANTTFADASTTVSGSTAINVDHASSATGLTLLLGNISMGGNTVTVTNGDSYNLTVGTVTSSAGPTFTNNMASGTLALGALTLTPATAQTATFNGTSSTAVTSVGNITQNGTNALAVTQSGSGALVLTGANAYTGATTVTSGILDVTGAINNANTANVGQVSVGNVAGNAELLIAGGTVNATRTTAPSVLVGSLASANGSVIMSSGTLATNSELWLSDVQGAYGSLTINGGTATIGSWLAMARGGGTGILNVNGGSLTVSTNNLTIGTIAGGTNQNAVATLTGGTTTISGSGNGVYVGEITNGVLDVSGSAALSATGSLGITFTNTANTSTGILNLNGGTITTSTVKRGNATGTTATLDFGGGTLKASGASTTFLNGLTNAFVQSGTSTIDNGGFAITVGQALLAPANSGVSAISLAANGTGYIDTPLVTITGGTLATGGVAATAVANFNYTTDQVTGITITNPGNYTSTTGLAVAFTGGGGTAPTINTITSGANASGGMTFQGNNTTTLTAAGTYTGSTTIASGTTLQLGTGTTGNDGSLSSTGISNSGTLDYNLFGNTVGGYAITGNGALILNDTGSTRGAISLTASSSYTGTTTISSGTLTLDDSGGNTGALGNTAVTLAGSANAILLAKGNATIGGSVTAGSGSLIDMRDSTVNTLTVAGNVNLTSSNIDLDIGTSSGSNDSLSVGGTVSVSGTETINLDALGTIVAGNSTYTLINATGGLSGNFTLGTKLGGFYAYSLSQTSNSEVLGITANATPSGNVYWTGSSSHANGDTANNWGYGAALATPASNWSTNVAGTSDPVQVPGATSDAYFTAQNASSVSGSLATQLDGAYSLKGLFFDTSVATTTISNVTINTNGNALTLGADGLTVVSTDNSNTTISGTGSVLVSGNQNWANNATANKSLTVSAPISALSGATTLTLNGSGTGGVTLSGNITDGGGQIAMVFDQAGTTVLSGTANTYSGGSTVSAGTVSISSNGNLGTTTAPVAINGGTLTTTATITNTHPFTIGASGGTIDVTTTGQYWFNTANTLLGSGTLTVTGNGAGTLTANTGNLRLAQTNTFNGNVILQSGGILEYGAASAIGSAGTITINNQGELAVNAGVTLPNAITVAGGTNSVLSFENGTTGIFSGNVTLNANASIGLRDWYAYGTSTSGTISGVISGSGSGITTTAGSSTGGVLALTNANTYAGSTTIATGTTLRANNTSGSATGTGTVTVQNGGTLGGSGFIGTSGTSNGAITVNSGGFIAAGATSTSATGTGLLTSYSTSGVALSAGSGYTWKINADTTHSGTAGGATGWDEIATQSIALGSSGTPLNSSSKFTVSINGAPASGFGYGTQLFPIATAVNGISLNGTAVTSGTNLSTADSNDFVLSTSGFTAPSSASGLTTSWQLEVVSDMSLGTSGQDLDLVYSATPEPGAAMLVLAGALPVLGARRRRRKVLGHAG